MEDEEFSDEYIHEMADEIISEDTQKILVMLKVDLKQFLQDAWEQAEVAEKVQDYLSDDQIEKLKNIGIDIKTASDTAIDATKSALNAEAVFFSAIFSLMYRLVSIGIVSKSFVCHHHQGKHNNYNFLHLCTVLVGYSAKSLLSVAAKR